MYVRALLAVLFFAGCQSNATSPGANPGAAKPAANSAASKHDLLEGIPLVWRPTTSTASVGAGDLTNLAGVKVQVNPLADSRAEKALIGQNVEKDVARKVTTPDDVAAFVTSHMKSLIRQAGYTVVDSGGTVILNGDVTEFFVTESNRYRSNVRIQIALADPSGKALWNGVTGGAATRFGRSYRAENYYEVLSDSVIEATNSLLQNASFQAAMAGKS